MCTQTSKTFIEILQDENNEIRKKLNSNLNAFSVNKQEISNKTIHGDQNQEQEPNIRRKQMYTKNVKTSRPGKASLLIKI